MRQGGQRQPQLRRHVEGGRAIVQSGGLGAAQAGHRRLPVAPRRRHARCVSGRACRSSCILSALLHTSMMIQFPY